MVIVFSDDRRESSEDYDDYASGLILTSIRFSLLDSDMPHEISRTDSIYSYPGCSEDKLRQSIKRL